MSLQKYKRNRLLEKHETEVKEVKKVNEVKKEVINKKKKK